MKTLHTISKTPISNLLTSCLEAISENDGVLFLEDGVYYTWKDTKDLICTEQYECYALKEDLLA
ncbi:MAG: DsrH/TusB family sulfur relay protein, partial [Pseudohongiellaceae bacterium]